MTFERFWSVSLAVALALAAPAAARSGDPATDQATAESAAESAAEAAPLRVADLDWLAGSWRGTSGGEAVEEHWSAPHGGEMVGMFRWDHEPPVYELLLIADAPEGAVIRLRHFGPGLVAWEEEEGALLFRPVEHGPCWALFAEVGDDEERTRLRYSRDQDGLLVQVIERRGGADGSLDFRYRPVGQAAAKPCG